MAVNRCIGHPDVLLYLEPHLFVLNAKFFIDLREFRAELAIDIRQIKLIPLIVYSDHWKRHARLIVNTLYRRRRLLLSLHRAGVDNSELKSLGEKVFTQQSRLS